MTLKAFRFEQLVSNKCRSCISTNILATKMLSCLYVKLSVLFIVDNALLCGCGGKPSINLNNSKAQSPLNYNVDGDAISRRPKVRKDKYRVIPSGQSSAVYRRVTNNRFYYQQFYGGTEGVFFLPKNGETIAPIIRRYDGAILRNGRVVGIELAEAEANDAKRLIKRHAKDIRTVLLTSVDRVKIEYIDLLHSIAANDLCITIPSYSGYLEELLKLKKATKKIAFLHVGLSRSPHSGEKIKGKTPGQRLKTLVKVLNKLPRIGQLSIRASDVKNSDIAPMQVLRKRLKSFALTMTVLEMPAVKSLSRFSSLERLIITVKSVDQYLLHYLGKLSSLRTLELHVREELFSSRNMKQQLDFTHLRSIQTLRVRVDRIKGKTLLALCGLSRLVNLTLELTNANKDVLRNIGCLRRVKNIEISTGRSVEVSSGIYPNCIKLRALSLHRITLSDSGLAELYKCTQLERIGLREASLAENSHKIIEGKHRLSAVDLRGNLIDDRIIPYLRRLKRLREVDLSETDISVAGLTSLLLLRPLRFVSYSSCKNIRTNRNRRAELKRISVSYVDFRNSTIDVGLLKRLIGAKSIQQILISGLTAKREIVSTVCNDNSRRIVDVCVN